jgi:hypothetical protein
MVVAPAVMMAVSAAPSVMVASAAHMTVTVAVTAVDLNDCIVLRGDGCHSEPGGCRTHHGEHRYQGSEADERNPCHEFFLYNRVIAIPDISSLSPDCFNREARKGKMAID